MRHRLPVPAHPTCVLIASISGLPKLSESARVRSPQIRYPADLRGHPGAFQRLLVCARAWARMLVRVSKRVCLYMDARAQIHSREQIKIPFAGDKCTTSKRETTT